MTPEPFTIGGTGAITTAVVADIFGVSRQTITRRVKSGDLTPLHRNPGRTGALLFDRDYILALAADTTRSAA